MGDTIGGALVPWKLEASDKHMVIPMPNTTPIDGACKYNITN